MATRKTVQLERGDLADLARVLGRSPGHLSRVIAGTREPSPELAVQISTFFDVPLHMIRLPGRGWRKGRKRSAQLYGLPGGWRKPSAARQLGGK